MPHMRQRIVEAFENKIGSIEGLPEGSIVHSLAPVRLKSDQPVIFVIPETETVVSERDDINAPRLWEREVRILVIIAMANTLQTNRFVLEDWAQKVEEKLAEDLTFDGLVYYTDLFTYQLEFEEGQYKPKQMIIAYNVGYVTLATDVGVSI